MRIRRILKHAFIPHLENDFKPHFFREKTVGIMVLLGVFLLGASFFSWHFTRMTVEGAKITSSVLIDLTNKDRVMMGENPLRKSDLLERAALLKGHDMAEKEYFAHNSPEGLTPWYFLKQAGYSFLYAGENLAINFTHEDQIEKAWIQSPLHRANIMNGAFREIGIAAVPGFYNNAPTLYIVEMFGTPAYSQVIHNSDIASTAGSTSSQNRSVLEGTASTTILGATFLYKNIVSVEDMATMKNPEAYELPAELLSNVEKYSTWVDKLIVTAAYYVAFFYYLFTGVIVIALLLMIGIEIRKQHLLHITYGVLVLLLIQLFIYINQGFL